MTQTLLNIGLLGLIYIIMLLSIKLGYEFAKMDFCKAEEDKPLLEDQKSERVNKYFATLTVDEVYIGDKYLLYNPDDLDKYYMILPGLNAHEGDQIYIAVHGNTMFFKKN